MIEQMENSDLSMYLASIESYDPYEQPARIIEQTSYAGHLYLNGSESFDSYIKSQEKRVLKYLENEINVLSSKTTIYENDLLPFRSLMLNLNSIINDDTRVRTLREWFQCSQKRDYHLLQYVEINELANQIRGCQFFWECLSCQILSAERVIAFLSNRIESIQISSLEDDFINKIEDFTFLLRESIDYNTFLDITTTLHRELIKEEFLYNSCKLRNFRSLFMHSFRRHRHEDINTLIVWRKNSYHTLSYFVKLIQEFLVVKPAKGSKRSNYKIALRRFVKKDNEYFKPNKTRHNLDPNLETRSKLNQVIEEIIQLNLIKDLPKELASSLRVSMISNKA